jgi:hypothetical protein
MKTKPNRVQRLTELVAALTALSDNNYDKEATHGEADSLLLQYIDDTRVTAAFESIDKWYA